MSMNALVDGLNIGFEPEFRCANGGGQPRNDGAPPMDPAACPPCPATASVENPVVVPDDEEERHALRAERMNRRSALESEIETLLAPHQDGATVPADVVTRFDSIEREIREIDRTVAVVDAALAASGSAGASVQSIRNRAQTLRNRPPVVQRRVAPAAPHFVRDVGDNRHRRNSLLALKNWAFPKDGTHETRSAGYAVGFTPATPLRIRLFESKSEREERASMTTAANLGGETIATMMAEFIEREIKAFNPLIDVARIYNHSQGGDFIVPTIDDTGNTGAAHTEGVAITPRALATDKKTLKSYGVDDSVEATRELIRDTYYADLPETIGELMGEAIGRKMADLHLLADGLSKPQGLVTGAGAGITTAANNAITMKDIIDLIASLDLGYQATARFFMSPVMWANLLALTDATGRPLIGDVQSADKPMLKGYPVELCPGMQGPIAATTVPMVFGAPKKFAIRLVGPLEITRLDEIAALRNAVVFYGIQFHDSRVISTKAIKKMTQKT